MTTDEEQLSPEVYQLLAAGRKIAAIKLIREETGMGLAEAKELADLLSGHDPATEASPAMKEEGGASGLIAIVVAILLAFLFYVFFVGD